MGSTRNRILLATAIVLAAIVIWVRYSFTNKLDVFKERIAIFQNRQDKIFQDTKDSLLESLRKSNTAFYERFTKLIKSDNYYIEKDTSYRFLYLEREIPLKYMDKSLLLCSMQRCQIELENEKEEKGYLVKYNRLKVDYINEFNEWYPKVKIDKLFSKNVSGNNCNNQGEEIYSISGNDKAWQEFGDFLRIYHLKQVDAMQKSGKAKYDLSRVVDIARGRLNTQLRNDLDNEINSSLGMLLEAAATSEQYVGDQLGTIMYTYSITKLNDGRLNSILDRLYEENWRYNSLSTGAMPYASCYGGSNSCDEWSCSKIKVITGGTGDVLVMVKNEGGRIVRHAYIRGGNSFTFNMPDGSYQVFFYSGSGWNPEKQMSSSNCTALKGGFVSSEDVTKDNYISLYSQVMTYELILQSNGNFSTKPSSKDEAF